MSHPMTSIDRSDDADADASALAAYVDAYGNGADHGMALDIAIKAWNACRPAIDATSARTRVMRLLDLHADEIGDRFGGSSCGSNAPRRRRKPSAGTT
ncbi:MAG TPA: hypothetical protein VF342_06205 [Alphaproteobacteria bacterium]